MNHFVNVGFGNIVSAEHVVAVLSPEAAPVKRQVMAAKEENKIIDASAGKKTKSVIYTDSGQLILSAIAPETLLGRFNGQAGKEE